jgi:hypothetical protein
MERVLYSCTALPLEDSFGIFGRTHNHQRRYSPSANRNVHLWAWFISGAGNRHGGHPTRGCKEVDMVVRVVIKPCTILGSVVTLLARQQVQRTKCGGRGLCAISSSNQEFCLFFIVARDRSRARERNLV